MGELVYETKILQRLAMFVLNRATSDLRSELHEYLVMLAISSDKERKGITKAQIVSVIEKDLQVSKFPDIMISSAIERLKEERFVEGIHGKSEDLYFLSQDKIHAFGVMEDLYSQTCTRIKESLSRKISELKGSPIDLGTENSAFAAFQKMLGRILSVLGEECCFALVSSRGKDLSSLKSVDVISAINEALSERKDDDHREVEQKAFREYLSEPDEDLSDYIFSLAQSYFIFNVLHLDPECSLCTKESLRGKKVFIDTNVIVDALIDAGKRNKATNYALRLTSELGINMVFSKRTKQEFDNLIQDCKQRFGKNPTIPKTRFEKISSDLEDGFLKDFWLKKQRQPTLTFTSYAERLGELATILKNRYSITYDDNDYTNIANSPDLPKLKDIVAEEGAKFFLHKSETVAEHDAFHILLIQELRKNDGGDILGPKYWFLTHDRSLFPSERSFWKNEVFSSIFLDSWVQFISPMLEPKQTKTARDAYANLFSSRLPMLSKTIDEDSFLTFQGAWVDDDDLKPQDIARIIGNRQIRNLTEKLEEEKKTLTDEERELIIKPVVEESKIRKKETQELKITFKSLDKKVSTLHEKVSFLETKVGRQNKILEWLGHFIGAVIFVVLWLVLYQYVLINSLAPWQAFLGAIVLAAIFGYLADFHGYKWLVGKLLGRGLPTDNPSHNSE